VPYSPRSPPGLRRNGSPPVHRTGNGAGIGMPVCDRQRCRSTLRRPAPWSLPNSQSPRRPHPCLFIRAKGRVTRRPFARGRQKQETACSNESRSGVSLGSMRRLRCRLRVQERCGLGRNGWQQAERHVREAGPRVKEQRRIVQKLIRWLAASQAAAAAVPPASSAAAPFQASGETEYPRSCSPSAAGQRDGYHRIRNRDLRSAARLRSARRWRSRVDRESGLPQRL
jgi:hypothetical protein